MSSSKPTLADQMSGSLPIVSDLSRSGFSFSHLILASGSTLLIYIQVMINMPEAIPFPIRVLCAWIAGFVWFKAVEHPLRKLILFAMAYWLMSKDERDDISPNLKRVGKSSVVATTLLLIATMGVSFAVNPDIAGAVTEEKDSSKEIAQSEKITGSYDRDVDMLREELVIAREKDATIIETARKDTAAMMTQARRCDCINAEMCRLTKRKGDTWAKGQNKKYRDKVKKAAIALMDKAKKEAVYTAPAQSTLNSYVSSRSEGRDTIALITTSIIKGRQDEYRETYSRRNGALWIIVLVAGLCMIMFARTLVLACAETGEEVDTQDPEGVATVAVRKFKEIGAWLAQKMDSAFGNKFALASVRSAPVTAPKGTHTPVPAPVPKSVPSPVTHPPKSVPPTAGTVVGRGVTGATPPAASVTTPEEITRLKTYVRVNYDRMHTAATANGKIDAGTNYEAAKSVLEDAGYTFTFGPDKRKTTVKKKGQKPKTISWKAMHLS